jgi:hypothetical protein
MRKSLTLMIAGTLMFAAGPVSAKTDMAAKAEARIAKITAGRTAEAPVDCIFLNQISSSEIVADTAIVYTMNNGTIYVNRPASGANFLDRDDVLVTDTHSSQLCSIDVVRLVDSTSRMPNGSVGLGKFVPYPRVRHSASR